MNKIKKNSFRKIALGTSSALLATIIAANGTGLAHAEESHNVRNHTTNLQKAKFTNANNYMDKNFDLRKRCFALMSAAEDSNFNYSKNYDSYSGKEHDGRGITAGLIGFTTGTGDMYEMIKYYDSISPNNPLSKYEKVLKNKHGDDTSGLKGIKDAWHQAYKNDHDNFVKAQNKIIKEQYVDKALEYAKKDNLSQLGQYIYFDAIIKHGFDGDGSDGPKDWGFKQMRNEAKKDVKTPAEGGNEVHYLKDFVGKNYDATLDEKNTYGESKDVTDRLDFQMKQLNNNNLDLKLPLIVHMNGMSGEDSKLTQEKINRLNDKDLASLDDFK
ncbi:chitosanase [Staphylococcus hominis]|uniref:chitosanase n=1 Tax=Staphylococcus hominis TaxID=1290 RepID=UPI000B3B648A|nr:chitosanase [Staphylococcus hominis]AUJ52635.1 chitosanase [Staphylococcus hominis subsp. hominis]